MVGLGNPAHSVVFPDGEREGGEVERGVCWEMTERLWHFPSIAKDPLGLQTSPRFPPRAQKKHHPASMLRPHPRGSTVVCEMFGWGEIREQSMAHPPPPFPVV